MRWAEDHKGLIKWRGREWRWIRRCVKMGKRECSDAYQWGRDGSSRLDKCSSRVALLSTLDGQLPFPTQPPIPIPYSKGFLPTWKSKAYHAHPQSRELWPLVISSITFLSLSSPFFTSLVPFGQLHYFTNTSSMFPLQQLCTCSTLCLKCPSPK